LEVADMMKANALGRGVGAKTVAVLVLYQPSALGLADMVLGVGAIGSFLKAGGGKDLGTDYGIHALGEIILEEDFFHNLGLGVDEEVE